MKKILAATLLSTLILSSNSFAGDLDSFSIRNDLDDLMEEVKKLQKLIVSLAAPKPDGVVPRGTTLYNLSNDCSKIVEVKGYSGSVSSNFEFSLRTTINCSERTYSVIRSHRTGYIYTVDTSDTILY